RLGARVCRAARGGGAPCCSIPPGLQDTPAPMYGFVEQLLHYFGRPHTALPAAPITGRGAWKGEELARSEEWCERLTDAHVAELQSAVETASRSGKPTRDLTVAEFPLST